MYGVGGLTDVQLLSSRIAMLGSRLGISCRHLVCMLEVCADKEYEMQSAFHSKSILSEILHDGMSSRKMEGRSDMKVGSG